jgi:VWFA-related protein
MQGQAARIVSGLMTGVMLGVVAIGAQEPAPPALPSAEFGASIDVRTVNVEVVVTDRKGQRVPGLKAGDFRLKVDGRQVPLDYFTEVRDGQAATPAAEPAQAGETAATAAPGAAPSVASGVPSIPPPADSVAVGTNYLVFVDDSFAVASDRNLMLKLLERDLPIGSADRMAIVAFDGRKLDLLKDWTGDRDVLRQTLREIQGRATHGIERLIQRARAAEDDSLDDSSVEGEWADLFHETQSAAQAAAAAMRGVAPPAGRKVLLLIAGGWASLPQRPLFAFPKTVDDRQRSLSAAAVSQNPANEPPPLERRQLPSTSNLASAEHLFEPVTGTANLLGYTIYPIVLTQHNVTAIGDDVLAAAPTPIEDLGFISTPWSRGVTDAMGFVARETGGKLLFNTLRTSVFTRIAADTRSYYGLGFTPEWRADGGNHRIAVEVVRRDLKVRNRSSFADLSKGEVAGLKRDSLLLFGITPQAEAMQVEAGKPKWAGIGRIEVPVTLIIPAKVLKPVPVEGGFVLRARVSMDTLDHAGGTSKLRDLPLMMKVPAAPRPGDFTRYHTTLKLRRTEQTVTFAVLDVEGEGQGYAELKLKP